MRTHTTHAVISMLRRPAWRVLLLLPLLVGFLSLGPGVSYGQVVLNADFNAGTPGQPPSLSPPPTPPNDSITLTNCDREGNSCLVQGPTGPFGSPGFINNSLRISNARGFGSDPFVQFFPDPALGSLESGAYTVTWSSLAEQVGKAGVAAVLGPGSPGPAAFTVNYQPDGTLKFQDGTGLVSTGVTYAPGVAQTFQALVRVGQKTFDLSIDGVQIGCGRPFFQTSGFTGLDRFLAAVLPPPAQPAAEAYAWDSISIVRSEAENTPPILDPIGSKTVNEGELLQFTVSATDCDGNPLTFSAVNLPLGATFDPNTRTFSWTPGSNHGGGQYYVTFVVSDGLATDSEEVTITVVDTVADADGDGVPDAFHAVLGGPDNCQFVFNPGQFDLSQNGVGDACENPDQNQVSIAASPDKPIYVLNERVTVKVDVTFTITGTQCVLIRPVDATSVHFDLFRDGAPVPRDQIVHIGGAVAVSALQEVCPGVPTTFTTFIVVNGPEAPYLFLPLGRYVGQFFYDSIGARNPDVNPDGTCSVAPTQEDPTPCQPVFQVRTVEALALWAVVDQTSALAETDALCDFIKNTLVTDPTTRKNLLGKCRAIRDKIARGSFGAACNDLNAFISDVRNALSKGKISQAEADFMLAKATLIKQLLVCP